MLAKHFIVLLTLVIFGEQVFLAEATVTDFGPECLIQSMVYSYEYLGVKSYPKFANNISASDIYVSPLASVANFEQILWEITPTSLGYFVIKNKHQNEYLCVLRNSVNRYNFKGPNQVLVTLDFSSKQINFLKNCHWTFEKHSKGSDSRKIVYTIANRFNNECIYAAPFLFSIFSKKHSVFVSERSRSDRSKWLVDCNRVHFGWSK
jgi:hypothetical protein